MVKQAQPLQDAEALVVELESAQARGDTASTAGRMQELEEAIAYLMDLNFKLAGNDKANALVASLQLRARKIREKNRIATQRSIQ